MSRPLKCRLSLSLALALIVAWLASPAFAHDYRLGTIDIIHPWARASLGQARSGATYMVIINGGEEPDRLIAVHTRIARKAGLHTQRMDNGVMKMRPVKAIEVAPGEPAVLEPGGLHIMLMGLKTPLVEGTSFPLTLTFEKAGTIDIEVKIQEATDMAPDKHTQAGS